MKLKKQPKPKRSKNAVNVFDVVHKLIDQRDKRGRETYGGTLYTFNGRDALVDALEESYDLTIYLTQLWLEREHGKK